MDDDSGWTTKATRQRKKNRNKPKGQSQSQSPNKKKQTRNQRRRRNRQRNQSKNGHDALDEKEPNVETVINSILRKHPRLKSDKDILKTVIDQMKLKYFDPTDARLNADLWDKIQHIKLSQMVGDDNGSSNNHIEENEDEDEDEDDDDEDDDQEEDEEDEESEDETYYNGKDEDESMDQKDSSESMREKTGYLLCNQSLKFLDFSMANNNQQSFIYLYVYREHIH